MERLVEKLLEARAYEDYKKLLLSGELQNFLPECTSIWRQDKESFILLFKESENILNHLYDLDNEDEDEDEDDYYEDTTEDYFFT